jgi:hypothetical protein
MKTIIKRLTIFVFTALILLACTKEEDVAIAPFKALIFSQDFEAHPYGSGATEIPINITNWSNFNTTNSRTWNCKLFSNNRYAEFSSFFSATGTTDNSWLISAPFDFTKTSNETLVFSTKTRFSNGAQLKVLVSTNYDGTQAGIASATWTQINAIMPTVDDVFTSTGALNLSAFEGTNVRIAFKYEGSKLTNKTTTFQIDDIKLYEN